MCCGNFVDFFFSLEFVFIECNIFVFDLVLSILQSRNPCAYVTADDQAEYCQAYQDHDLLLQVSMREFSKFDK